MRCSTAICRPAASQATDAQTVSTPYPSSAVNPYTSGFGEINPSAVGIGMSNPFGAGLGMNINPYLSFGYGSNPFGMGLGGYTNPYSMLGYSLLQPGENIFQKYPIGYQFQYIG